VAPGGSATVTANFFSGTGVPTTVAVRIAPGTGATGGVELSSPESATDSPNGGFACSFSATPTPGYECLWNDGDKSAGDTASLTFTVTARDDASGDFVVTSARESGEPVPFDDATLTVTAQEPTSTTTTTAVVVEDPTTTVTADEPDTTVASTETGAPLSISG
jgi:hypothetical protein